MENIYKYKFTIFTSCYNSEHVLHRVYDSLVKQTYRNFEWILINDASSDDTIRIINNFIAEANFPINFINLTENYMKMMCMNVAVAAAQGEFFIPADHDDSFKPNTLEKFMSEWDSIGEIEKKEIAGVQCLCEDQNGNLVGDVFPGAPCISDIFYMRYDQKVKGEKWHFIKTEIMREFPFPTVDRYVLESSVWFAIGLKYKFVFLNDRLRIYYVNQENRQTLSIESTFKYLAGYRWSYLEMVNKFIFKMLKDPQQFIRTLANYSRFSLLMGYRFSNILNDVIGTKRRMLVFSTYPLGYLLAHKDRILKRV